MRIVKKSLACIVALTLCLTAFVGAISVNAESPLTGTITVDSVTVTNDATYVPVPVTLEADAGIAAARFNVELAAGLQNKLIGITVSAENEALVTWNTENGICGTADEFEMPIIAENKFKLICETKDDGTGLKSNTKITVNLIFNASELANAEYTIAVSDVEAGDSGDVSDSNSSNPIELNVTNGKITTVDNIFGNLGLINEGATTIDNTEYYVVTFLSGINNLNYKKVGFEVTVNGYTLEQSATSVYTSYTAAGVEHDPTDFDVADGYISGLGIAFPSDFVDAEVNCRAFAEDMNGNIIYGATYATTIGGGNNG